jgi:hypothetical protein
MGYHSGRYNQTGGNNVIAGYQAGHGASGQSYSNNVLVGYKSGYSVTTGGSNTFLGWSSGYSNTTGTMNVQVGYYASRYNITGASNVCVGYEAGRGVSTNSYNRCVFLGHRAGQVITTGQGNIAIGYQTGNNITDGQYNIAIGYDIDPLTASGDYQFVIGNATYPFLRGDMSIYALAIYGANGYLNFNTTLGETGYGIRDNAGNMEYKDSGGSWTTMSGAGGGGGLFSEDSDDNIVGGTGAGDNLVGASATDNFLGGVSAGNAITTGDNNIAIGNESGYYNQTGGHNTVIGYQAGKGVTGNSYASNVFIGRQSGYLITTGGFNVFMGNQSGNSNTTGANNTFVGYQSAYYNETGASNVAIGRGAGMGASGQSYSYNTFVGQQAANATTTGGYNAYVGYRAGYSNTTGISNVSMGYQSYYFAQAGNNNTIIGRESAYGVTANNHSNNAFLGYRAGYSITTGSTNVMVGSQVGYYSTSGVDNVYVGYYAARYNVTGASNVVIGREAGQGVAANSYSYNTFMGWQAGYVIETGGYNTFIGGQAGVSATTATSSVFVGYRSGYYNQTGASNVMIGAEAGRGASGQSNQFNVFVGRGAGYSVTVGGDNAVMGYYSNYFNQSGQRNVVIGKEAGYGVTGNSHSNNVFVGYRAGYSMTTGTDNIFIGYKSGYNETGSNKLYIENSDSTSPLIYGEFDNDLVRINGDLEVTGSFPALTNLLSNAGFGVWSNSTLEGADREHDLVTNGGFGSDTSDWTPSQCTLASIGGGQAGNCLELTRTEGSTQLAYQTITTEIGKLYKFTAYVKSGTSGNEAFNITVWSAGFGAVIELYSDTSSGSWVQYEVVFEAIGTSSIVGVQKNTATAGTMLFDTAECYAVADQLLSNGGFPSDASDWDPTDCTLASVGGGRSGNCLEMTRTGGTVQKVSQTFTTEAGKLYKASIYFKSGTSGNEEGRFKIYDGGWATIGELIATTTGSWVQHEIVFEAPDTTTHIQIHKGTATAGTMLFDTAFCHEVVPGCVAANSLGADGWWKDTTIDLYREHNGANTKDGDFYSLKTVPTIAEDYVRFPRIYQNEEHIAKFKGRTITFGAWVKTSTANDLKLRVTDGVGNTYSPYHTGGGAWEWLEVTDTVNDAADQFYVMIQHKNASPGTAYISQPMLVFGSSIGEGNYVPKPEETIYFEAGNISLNSYTSVSVSVSATINLEAESNGAVPKGAKAARMRIFASGTVLGSHLSLQTNSVTNEQGIQVKLVAESLAHTAIGWVPCDSNGDIYILRSATFGGAYIQINGVQLR